MIMVKCYKILNNMCMGPTVKVLERWPNDSVLPFDPDDEKSCYNYLRSKYGHVRTKEGVPIAYEIIQFGGIKGVPRTESYIRFFPGVDEEGNNLPLAVFGRLDNVQYEAWTNQE